jgi:hypothetical protein
MEKSASEKRNDELSIALVFSLDAIFFSTKIIDTKFRQLQKTLIDAEEMNSESFGDDLTVSLLGITWAIVDEVFRLREVSQNTPFLKKKKFREVRKFLEIARSVEPLRHYIQHLKESIRKIDANALPLWGSISWQSSKDELTSFTLIPGTLMGSMSAPTLTFDTHTSSFVERIALHTNAGVVDIHRLCEATAEFERFMSTWLLNLNWGNDFNYTPNRKMLFKASFEKHKVANI